MIEQARLSLDKVRVKRGELIEVHTLMPLQMQAPTAEAGGTFTPLRPTDLTCKVAGATVFSAEIGSSVATTAYFAFKFTARQSGPVEVAWSFARGQPVTLHAEIVVV